MYHCMGLKKRSLDKEEKIGIQTLIEEENHYANEENEQRITQAYAETERKTTAVRDIKKSMCEIQQFIYNEYDSGSLPTTTSSD